MNPDQPRFFNLLRRFEVNINEYTEHDVAQFRPSHEYVVSRESKSCPNCRTLIYNTLNDIKTLTLIEIINYRYFPPKTTYDKVADFSLKMSKYLTFSKYDFYDFDKFSRQLAMYCIVKIKSNLAISDKVLELPVLHRCNKCFKAWNIHYELKQRFVSGAFTNKITDWIDDALPQSQIFKGLILLNELTENQKISNHILDVKKMFIDNKEDLLNHAKKETGIGNINGAIAFLNEFVSQDDHNFFQSQVLQLQARHSAINQEKIRGIISYQDEVLQKNKISNDILSLIEEIVKYKNM